MDLGKRYKSTIKNYLKDDLRKDTSLYALITAFNIQDVVISTPVLLKFVNEKAGKAIENLDEFKDILIANIKNPENDEFFRRLGDDKYIAPYVSGNVDSGDDAGYYDSVGDLYDKYIDAVNDNHHR